MMAWTMQALTFSRFGGPEVLTAATLPAPALAPRTALVRMRAIGVNFADVYRRRGNYHLEGAPPWVLGYEGAGVIEAMDDGGEGAGHSAAFRVGDRVAFADVAHANAELVRAPLERLVRLPEDITFDVAAAVLLQGLTAHYLVHDSHALGAGELAVVHAAAGGVGQLLVQLAKHAGARVLAVASSDEKCALARRIGADDAVRSDDDWVARAQALGAGRGADVVYDSVGSTLDASLRAARVGGHVVFYGMAGGDPAPVDPRRLMDESKTLTGGDLWNVLTSHEERVRRSDAIFELIASGALRVEIAGRVPLARGAEAHTLLESRTVTGKLLLIPDGA